MRNIEIKKNPRLSADDVKESARKCEEIDSYFTDPFMTQRNRLNNLFGRDYIDANPVLVAAAVMQEEMEALRLEIMQLQIAITDATDRTKYNI